MKKFIGWLFRRQPTMDPAEIHHRQQSLANAMLCFMI